MHMFVKNEKRETIPCLEPIIEGTPSVTMPTSLCSSKLCF